MKQNKKFTGYYYKNGQVCRITPKIGGADCYPVLRIFPDWQQGNNKKYSLGIKNTQYGRRIYQEEK